MARIFVYGSLRRGQRHHDVLGNATFVRDATTEQGWALYDLGPYPAMARGDGVVVGEIHEIDDAMLPVLDAFEGEPYERIVISVGGESAFAYVFATPRGTLIPSGDWTKT